VYKASFEDGTLLAVKQLKDGAKVGAILSMLRYFWSLSNLTTSEHWEPSIVQFSFIEGRPLVSAKASKANLPRWRKLSI
jgi:hypothetical protein